MHSPSPSPITLVFGPKFGAYHNYGPNDVRYVVDHSLAGAIRPIKKHSKIEIGRSSECTIQIGRDSGVDDNMRPLLNSFSRKHCTLLWMDAGSGWRWVVLHGGIFVDEKTGTREASDPPDGVFLNGRRLPKDNPEPLFENGRDFAKLSLGLHGRIIVQAAELDSNTTSYPAEIWTGDDWPSKEDTVRTGDTSPGLQRIKAEDAIAASAAPSPTLISLGQEFLKFISTPKTPLGALYRLVLAGIVAFVVVAIMGAEAR